WRTGDLDLRVDLAYSRSRARARAVARDREGYLGEAAVDMTVDLPALLRARPRNAAVLLESPWRAVLSTVPRRLSDLPPPFRIAAPALVALHARGSNQPGHEPEADVDLAIQWMGSGPCAEDDRPRAR